MALLTKLQKRIAPAERERGAVLVLTALVMLLLLFIAAFATDLGAWYRQGQEQQRAADVGALNGIQAYDRGVKAYFATVQVSPGIEARSWEDLRDFDNLNGTMHVLNAEEAGLAEAAETIIGLLETSGLSFSNPGVPSLAADPLDFNDVSTWTIVADDLTEVVITRSFVQTGVESDGVTPVWARAIDVSITAPGEQYFSNILRDAPDIDRTASSVLSNCGAVCQREITILPPFTGFDADGSGDGYTPLLHWNDDGTLAEVWAVNHHVWDGWEGDILCRDAATKTSCGTFALSDYETGLHPIELLSESQKKIYTPATDRATQRAGILCFDVVAKNFCSTPFIGLWDTHDVINGWPEWGTPTTGVFEYNNRLWVSSDHATIACVNYNMTSCGEWNTAASAHGTVATENDGVNRTAWGGLEGSELFLIHRGTAGQPLFHCFDLADQQSCNGWGNTVIGFGTDWDQNETVGFFRYDGTSATPFAFCLAQTRSEDRSACRNLTNGSGAGAVPNINPALADVGNNWVGSAFSWQGQRTFFAGGRSDAIGCFDWTTGLECVGNVDLEQARPGNNRVGAPGPRTGSEEVEPYAFAQVTDNCLIGLGDQSFFFSFNPGTLDACVETSVTATITPCDCSDGNGTRWGEIRLPDRLLNETTMLVGTVSATENGPPIAGIDAVDLHTTGTDGLLDLTNIMDSDIVETTVEDGETVPVVYLTLELDSAIDPLTGQAEFSQPVTANLEIVVQPTLTS